MPISIEEANRQAVQRIFDAQPVLVDMKYAQEVFPQMTKYTVLHAGPPIEWNRMCGPLQGAIMGALRYEGLASNEKEALNLISSGKVKFEPCHYRNAVGPMTGIITSSMPLFEVKNETFGNLAYCPINEGLGKVLRFGANDDEVIARLHWLEKVLAPVLKETIRTANGINLKAIIAQALTMGDELHQRNVAATSLFVRAIMPHLVRVGLSKKDLGEVTDFLVRNDQFFLNLAMAAGKATMDPVKNIPHSTVVTAMSRNGSDFGIQISGLGKEWFIAPTNIPQGLYFPGFGPEDANPDLGDSAILETMGIGAFTMAASPAVVKFVGAGTMEDAINYTQEMGEITVGKSPHFLIPTLNFEGAPTGIDIRKVIEAGILPVINTGIAHKKPGVGQIGAGIVRAPLGCFEKALAKLAKELGV